MDKNINHLSIPLKEKAEIGKNKKETGKQISQMLTEGKVKGSINAAKEAGQIWAVAVYLTLFIDE